MNPGETIVADGEIELNAGRRTRSVEVSNRGDRPVQVGSHYHFAETNAALDFDRKGALGMRLNIPAGTAVRFEPGQSRTVELVDYAGRRAVYGFNAKVMGALEGASRSARVAKKPAAVAKTPAVKQGRPAAGTKRKVVAAGTAKRGAKR